MSNILFEKIDWNIIPKIEFPGENGSSFSQTIEFEGLRIRIVEYQNGFLANHCCKKGHISTLFARRIYNQIRKWR